MNHNNKNDVDMENYDNDEPLLQVENRRFTILPIKYPKLWELYKKQQALFWKAEEIDFSQDYNDMRKLNENEQHFIKMVLAFFASSDGIINFNLRERFLSDVQIMEAQVVYAWQMMMENVHCVSGNTLVLTDKGHHKIIDHLGKKINVWNGKEFSETEVKFTGDSVLYRVELTNGMKLDCTPQHKWFLRVGDQLHPEQCKKEIVYTQNLQINDVVHNYDLPIIDNIDIDEFKNPYIHGFFCGDGTYCNNYPLIDLYGEKMKLLEHFNVDKVQELDFKYRFYITEKINKEKYCVPVNYSVNTKLRWLEGICDSDGRIILNRQKTATSIQISSSNFKFVSDIQLMLTTLGVNSNVSSGSKKEYLSKNNYVLYITTYNVGELTKLGFCPKRLQIKVDNLIKKKEKLTRVKSVTLLEGIHKTYCFCEPKEHAGIFNGILTGQSESYSLMLDNIVRDPVEKDKLFNSIKTVESVKLMAGWAFKWIESSKSFAHRLIAFAIIEGIFFSGAFAAIFWLKRYRAKGKHFLNGLIKSNEFISRDEGLHVEFACELYNILNHKLSTNIVFNMIDEAIQISNQFTEDAIPCKLIGMNADLMSQYLQYIGDRLLVSLGYPKKYNTENPFDFMVTIGLPRKNNFFESRTTDYQSAHNKSNDKKIVRLDYF